MSDMETCGNCGHRIGKLEEAHFWKDHVVCTACKDVLTRAATGKSSKSKVGAAQPASSSSSSSGTAAIKLVPRPDEVEVDLKMKDDDEVVADPRAEAFPAPDFADAPAPRAGQPQRSTGPTTYPCSQCGGVFPSNEISRDGGQLLCQTCATFAVAADDAQSETPMTFTGGRSALPPWLPLAIAGAVLAVVIVVSALFLIHGGDEDEQSATPPPVRKPAPAPIVAVPEAPATEPVAEPAPAPAPAAPAAPVAAVDDANEAQKLLDAMVAADELEAAGKQDEALNHYRGIVDTLSAKPARSDSQSKTLARAQAAVDRLTASVASANKPAAPTGGGFDSNAPAVDDSAPMAGVPEEEVIAGQPAKPKPAAVIPGAVTTPGAIASAGKPTLAPPRSPSAATTKPATGIDIHLENGKTALASGDYPAAMTAFKDALDFDKKSAHAMHGIGLTHHFMSEQSKAIEVLEKAVVAGPNRALIFNLAVVHMTDNPMRAAKYVKEYLARPNVPLDEPLQNVLGAALEAAGATDARNGQVFVGLRDFYFKYDYRLAVARKDGNKRWGSKWIKAEQADVKWQTSKTRVAEADKTETEYQRAKIRTTKAEEKLNDLNRSFGLVPERKYVEARQGIKSALLSERQFLQRRDAARAALNSTEMPVFQKDFQFVPIDCLTVEQHPPLPEF